MDEADSHQLSLLEQYHEEAFSESCSGANTKAQMEITKKYESKGLKFHKKWYSVQEKKQLHENFQKFVEENIKVIGNPLDFAVTSTDNERYHEVKRLRRELGYYKCLAAGLFREASSIINNAYMSLSPGTIRSGEKFTPEELAHIQELVQTSGRQWVSISKELGRSRQSVQSAYRNHFDHSGEFRTIPPTKREEKKLFKIMEKKYPELDLTCQMPYHVPWNEIAQKVDYVNGHGKLLHLYWCFHVKYRDERGRLHFKKETYKSKLPLKSIRNMVKEIARSKVSHHGDVNWDYWFQKHCDHWGSPSMAKHVYRSLLKHYRVSESALGFLKASHQLYKLVKREKKLGFESIWKQIRKEPMPVIRWQQFHWAQNPELSQYISNQTVMQVDDDEDNDVVDESPDDEVW